MKLKKIVFKNLATYVLSLAVALTAIQPKALAAEDSTTNNNSGSEITFVLNHLNDVTTLGAHVSTIAAHVKCMNITSFALKLCRENLLSLQELKAVRDAQTAATNLLLGISDYAEIWMNSEKAHQLLSPDQRKYMKEMIHTFQKDYETTQSITQSFSTIDDIMGLWAHLAPTLTLSQTTVKSGVSATTIKKTTVDLLEIVMEQFQALGIDGLELLVCLTNRLTQSNIQALTHFLNQNIHVKIQANAEKLDAVMRMYMDHHVVGKFRESLSILTKLSKNFMPTT